jgi:pyruvate dehydrogenase E2 component (dihydrolipoamide acetyltransferase)
MERATLSRWLVSVGDTVKIGDLLAEVEADKATMEVEATDAGRISEILVDAGTSDVAVGAVIARLGSPEEVGRSAAAPVPATVDIREGCSGLARETVQVSPAVVAELPEICANATPLARRIATAKGIALEGIRGSGPNDRVTMRDLGLRRRPSSPSQEAAPAPAENSSRSNIPPAGVPVETIALSSMRRTIARRLTEAKQSVPHFYLTVHCNLDPLLALRRELNATLANRGVKLSINDLLTKAMALALRRVPDANVQFGGDTIHRFGRVDMSLAVAIDGGLVTPVIRDVAALSLSSISRTSKDLAERARAGKLAADDFRGGSASLSNLGMFGVDEIVPILNPPQGLILGIGAGIERPWNVNGSVAMATAITATASFDHRAIDGAIGAAFMSAFRDHVETPLLLLS